MPTRKLYQELRAAMGYLAADLWAVRHNPGLNPYNPDLIPDMRGHQFWVSSRFVFATAWQFNGSHGDIDKVEDYSRFLGAVRCVRPAAAEQRG